MRSGDAAGQQSEANRKTRRAQAYWGTISPEVRCRGDPALMPQAGPLRAVETEPGEQVVAGLSSFWAAPSERAYRTSVGPSRSGLELKLVTARMVRSAEQWCGPQSTDALLNPPTKAVSHSECGLLVGL